MSDGDAHDVLGVRQSYPRYIVELGSLKSPSDISPYRSDMDLSSRAVVTVYVRPEYVTAVVLMLVKLLSSLYEEEDVLAVPKSCLNTSTDQYIPAIAAGHPESVDFSFILYPVCFIIFSVTRGVYRSISILVLGEDGKIIRYLFVVMVVTGTALVSSVLIRNLSVLSRVTLMGGKDVRVYTS